jgi:hypothetical protein
MLGARRDASWKGDSGDNPKETGLRVSEIACRQLYQVPAGQNNNKVIQIQTAPASQSPIIRGRHCNVPGEEVV